MVHYTPNGVIIKDRIPLCQTVFAEADYKTFIKPAMTIVNTIAPNTPAEKHVTNCCVISFLFPF